MDVLNNEAVSVAGEPVAAKEGVPRNHPDLLQRLVQLERPFGIAEGDVHVAEERLAE
jgi:hypothetical protein